MPNLKIAVFVGTRPEIIKMQPIVQELKSRSNIATYYIHTGQHYDYNMSAIFVKELYLPTPDLFLNVKSGFPGAQVAKIVAKSEQAIRKIDPEIILVQGDTNSTLGVALAAAKMKLPVGHVEAGCRSFDRNMPEELNRTIVADLATHNFAPTETCMQNLLREGIPKEAIHLVGHPIADLLKRTAHLIDDSMVERFGLDRKNYYLVTLHREENVENSERLRSILRAMHSLSERRKIIFPIHPRTKKNVNKFGLKKYLRKGITVPPVGYMDALALLKNAFCVLTDSGGIQQEAATLGTPCITLRTKTEWVETVENGVNFLAGYRTEKILKTEARINEEISLIKENLTRSRYLFGKPPISPRIVDILEKVS